MERATCKHGARVPPARSFFSGALCMMLYTPKDAELKDIDICEVLAQAVHYTQSYGDM